MQGEQKDWTLFSIRFRINFSLNDPSLKFHKIFLQSIGMSKYLFYKNVNIKYKNDMWKLI